MKYTLLPLLLMPMLFLAGDPSTVGFSPANATAQNELEARYDAELDAQLMLDWMKFLTLRPHHAGSTKVKENAEWIAKKFKEWGFETEIEVYDVLLPKPILRRLTLLKPTRYEAELQEPALIEDSVADAIVKEGLPPYNAYSADGDVTAELVYVNQGLPRDYEELERRGIDVKGKIVIARYGGSWRGIKPKVAAEKGAIGCLIFNDPLDDGFYQGASYPDGAFKHKHAVQRGSVLDLPKRPGDPLTPGYGAVEGAKRLSREEADTIMKIPVLPISYADAKPLMAALGGDVVPRAWRGAMPVTYRTGPGPAVVHLELKFDWSLVPAYNVIARMEGSERPDQWVIRGNHHDAWVVGASDPISGLVALMAQARATGELARKGWRPKRTLVFCAWDAEEPALLGSTDWVEHHAEELKKKAVAYINTDGSSRGFLHIGGSHAFESMVNQVAGDVTDPHTGVSVAQRLFSANRAEGTAAEKAAAKAGTLHLAALGSGSDYSAFLQHLGIPTLNLGFGGEGRGGEYHTNFDTFDHYTRFKDPGLVYGVTLAQVCGRLSLRMAEADVLPFDFTGTARAISSYLEELMRFADKKRDDTRERNELILGGHLKRLEDPRHNYADPKPKVEVPFFNFAPLQTSVAALKRNAQSFHGAINMLVAGNKSLDADSRENLDQLLYHSEQTFMGKGLPRRPWFRHQIYAPGFYTGYGVKTLPGVREGIEQGNYEEAQEQIHITAAAIQRMADQIQKAVERIN